MKEQNVVADEWKSKKKLLRDEISQADKKLSNLMSILEMRGKKAEKLTAILEEVDSLHSRILQLRLEIEKADWQIAASEQQVFSAEVIRDNINTFSKIFDQLTPDEQYDLLHLLIKKIVYFEDKNQAEDGSKSGKIKIELWELPELSKKKEVL